MTEVIIATDASHTPHCWISQDGTPSDTTIPISTIIEDPFLYIFAFRNAHHLFVSFASQTIYNSITKHARVIRLYILRELQVIYPHRCVSPATPTVTTPTSTTSDNSEASIPPCNSDAILPNLEDIMERWRFACRAIPHGHDINFVCFELSAPDGCVPAGICRMLQILSTVLSIKEREKGRFRCGIEGCDRTAAERFDPCLVGNVAIVGWSLEDD
ncbi:hypothetical protein BO94DRAFT_614038 [Aspergillus sclerotioniger CBS 115572]|uniref:Uncharacterized protein n=1 Tax=Aspergillus sclerotioniger CBS 115572 TaxID=1450535 RepID=A0A317UVK4_9EURO|nr:hypothetical protein BO94DRAFT_614038 [Aspergillus sclerotioniger CBS 115572]PWY66064.1 hypothetical protein BO94DRAFT_614038 [Aspergillus sclerotioniger CBS 115572]